MLMRRFWRYPPAAGPVLTLLPAGLLIAVLLAAWLFLEACGAVLPFRPWLFSGCTAASATGSGLEIDGVLGRRAVLEERVAALETRLAG